MLERRSYADPGFPCSILQLENSASSFQTHWHDEIEIIYAATGPIDLILDGVAWQVPAGGAALVNSGQLHEARLTGTCAGRIQLVVFHPDLWLPRAEDTNLGQLIDDLHTGTLRLPTLWLPGHEAARPVLIQLQSLLAMPDEGDHAQRLAVRGLLCLLLASMLKSGQALRVWQPEQDDRRNQIERIKAPLAWLHNHYAAEIRIAQLARMANFSESHFSRVFRQIVGQPVVSYLLEYRLRQAARLLTETDARITDIALNCGFTSQGYFSRCFKKRYQVTPNHYRQGRSGRLP